MNSQPSRTYTRVAMAIVVAAVIIAAAILAASTYGMKNTGTTSEITTTTQTTIATVLETTTATQAAACIPISGYISTTTIAEESTTTTAQVVYDGTPCDFGDGFEPPSAILVPANTLTWANFQLQANGSYDVGGGIHFLSFPGALGANITVAIYLNGNLTGSSTTPISQIPNEITNSSSMPSSNSTNSIIAQPEGTPNGGVGVQIGQLNLAGTTISIAFLSDKPLWVSGWTPEDMSKGSGPQFGQSLGQLAGTYEWPDSGSTLPNSLPQLTSMLTFELQITGDYLA